MILNTHVRQAALAMMVMLCGCYGSAGNDTDNRSGLPNGRATRAQVLRGRYLVLTSGCAGCHNRGQANPYDPNWLGGYLPNTPGQPFVIGGPGPAPGPSFYMTYPANLTPDNATGLGTWTAQDIFNALSTGKDPNGVYLSPPMPWPDIRNMVPEDLWSIAAYLENIKPVSNAVPDSQGPNVDGRGKWASVYQGLPPAGIPPFPTPNENDIQ